VTRFKGRRKSSKEGGIFAQHAPRGYPQSARFNFPTGGMWGRLRKLNPVCGGDLFTRHRILDFGEGPRLQNHELRVCQFVLGAC
jgi:hypothetical protein